jgi:hypothetical protein
VRAWYRSCLLASGVETQAALAREVSQICGLDVDSRSWSRYATGAVTPSISRKGNVGLVERIGWVWPNTVEVFKHPLWETLAINTPLSTSQVNAWLRKLDQAVWNDFLSIDGNGQAIRDWNGVRHPIWRYPTHPELIIDYLTAYFLLFREAVDQGRQEIKEIATDWVQTTLEALPTSPVLGEMAPELAALLMRRFFTPAFTEEPYINQVR